jgi:putative transposase
VLHHSDRSVQYASNEYRALLEGQKAVARMSRKGNYWDNAVAESFFATVEIELIEDADWQTRTRREVPSSSSWSCGTTATEGTPAWGT